eukprot:4623208-Prymnesium_polylepis.1
MRPTTSASKHTGTSAPLWPLHDSPSIAHLPRSSHSQCPPPPRRVRGVHYVDTAKAGSIVKLKFFTSP